MWTLNTCTTASHTWLRCASAANWAANATGAGGAARNKSPLGPLLLMYKEFAKAFLDVAKYILTAVIISTFFTQFEDSVWIYIVGVLLIALFTTISILLFRIVSKKENEIRMESNNS